ncbi:hypothetical protein M378DRAFT_188351 [Amanita muscaria Koide BX008]|uniref:Uncharacterized protein n=1 Tax=Amanita muscaria (strain Koide BX008) TaxID=946122 RepID=A0A0C2S5D2_AMAMK|nr:hypothetical protein M378DRAFT_188351 [Amanita muscaria Koide BX008]
MSLMNVDNSFTPEIDVTSTCGTLCNEMAAQPVPLPASWAWNDRNGGLSWEEHCQPPTEEKAQEALREIDEHLSPLRSGKHRGYKEPRINSWSKSRLQGIRTMLNLYTGEKSETKGSWTKSSGVAVQSLGKQPGHGRTLRKCARLFVLGHSIPKNPYRTWTKSRLDADSNLGHDVQLHLQSIGKYVHAQDIVDYLKQQDVQEKYGLTSSIALATAKRWMQKFDYRWVQNHKGQYVNGHEREDVVNYRQNLFLPTWYSFEQKELVEVPKNLEEGGRRLIAWFHDESIFYAHDWQTSQWVKKGTAPLPYKKGEGASLMVADFVSADYGFLQSRDGKESAQVIFRPGKNHDGYFDHDDIITQVETAIKILTRNYPDEEHMPKLTPKDGTNWGVEVIARSEDRNIIHRQDGKLLKVKVRMGNGRLPDGSPQDFYFPPGHPCAGAFKGMAQILKEHDLGKGDPGKIRAECPKFQCTGDNPQCCCRRILYNQPDFTNIPSLLETFCSSHGHKVLFLPKFHCELNFIEQCWGRAKYLYRMNPPSSRAEDLERNMLSALDSITIDEIRKYSCRSCRFMDAYRRGLNARQAAWAGKRYRGHRVLPNTIMEEIESHQVDLH